MALAVRRSWQESGGSLGGCPSTRFGTSDVFPGFSKAWPGSVGGRGVVKAERTADPHALLSRAPVHSSPPVSCRWVLLLSSPFLGGEKEAERCSDFCGVTHLRARCDPKPLAPGSVIVAVTPSHIRAISSPRAHAECWTRSSSTHICGASALRPDEKPGPGRGGRAAWTEGTVGKGPGARPSRRAQQRPVLLEQGEGTGWAELAGQGRASWPLAHPDARHDASDEGRIVRMEWWVLASPNSPAE